MCVPSYMCAQTPLHALRGYCGSALMCSSVIIRTLLCPIRHGDRQWKYNIDYLHFIIKPITTWKGEGKKWNKDENKLQWEEDKDSLFPAFHFISFQCFWTLWLNVTKAFKHLFGTECYLGCGSYLVCVCLHVCVCMRVYRNSLVA